MTSVIGGLDDAIRSPFFRGASVTIPLKERVVDLITTEEGCELSQDAVLAGSVNTISLTASGKLRGDNTDIMALRSVLRYQCKTTSNCVIVGTGGAARGAIVAALSVCKNIYVFGRDGEKVKKLCDDSPGIKAWDSSQHVDVMIACVPSSAQSEMLTHIQFPRITCNTTLVEMAYVPAQTPLVLEAVSLGASVVYGSEILLLQALEQHKIWIRSLEVRNELTEFFIPTEIDPNTVRKSLEDFTSRFHNSLS
jgi:shikimate dehydrogenase